MRFTRCRRPTVGMELEWQLVDRESLDLVSGILPLVERFEGSKHVTPEYMQSAVEINSPVCENTEELGNETRAIVREVQEAAADLDMRLCGAGTHPFSERLADVTPYPRYRRIEREVGLVGYTQLTFAMHVHVGMPSGDDAMRTLCGLIPCLPALIAVSSNSPYFRSMDTAFASYRLRVLALGSRYGTPPYIHTWRRFNRAFSAAKRAQMFDTIKDTHWHVRPHPEYGTVEIRIMDVQPTVTHAAAVAAFVHALTVFILRSKPDEVRLPRPLPWWLEMENRYNASHYGLQGLHITNDRGQTRPLQQLVDALIDLVTPTAEELGDAEDLQRLKQWVNEEGPGYRRQRELYAQDQSLRDVIEAYCEELEHDLWVSDWPRPSRSASPSDMRP